MKLNKGVSILDMPLGSGGKGGSKGSSSVGKKTTTKSILDMPLGSAPAKPSRARSSSSSSILDVPLGSGLGGSRKKDKGGVKGKKGAGVLDLSSKKALKAMKGPKSKLKARAARFNGAANSSNLDKALGTGGPQRMTLVPTWTTPTDGTVIDTPADVRRGKIAHDGGKIVTNSLQAQWMFFHSRLASGKPLTAVQEKAFKALIVRRAGEGESLDIDVSALVSEYVDESAARAVKAMSKKYVSAALSGDMSTSADIPKAAAPSVVYTGMPGFATMGSGATSSSSKPSATSTTPHKKAGKKMPRRTYAQIASSAATSAPKNPKRRAPGKGQTSRGKRRRK